jgi:hypothetical protein
MSIGEAAETRSSGVPPARHDALDGRSGPAAQPTPLYTRHMLGAVEAERSRRGARHATRRWLPPAAKAHPRIAAAHAAEARRILKARADYSRWADDGGRFDPEAAARVRIAGRQMKRCNS